MIVHGWPGPVRRGGPRVVLGSVPGALGRRITNDAICDSRIYTVAWGGRGRRPIPGAGFVRRVAAWRAGVARNGLLLGVRTFRAGVRLVQVRVGFDLAEPGQVLGLDLGGL